MTDSIHKFEYYTKQIISMIYRLFIVTIGISILILEKNYFDWYIYSIGISLYLLMYYKILNNQKAINRLIIDYIFIVFILYDKNLFSLLQITLFLLPFINSPNHTSKNKKTSQLFFISLISFSFLYFSKNDFTTLKLLEIIGSLVIITLIISLEYIKSLLIKNILDGYQKIDDIDFEKSRSSNIPGIYNKVIDILNDILFNNFYIKSKIQYITCFIISNNNISIKNSSNFFQQLSISQNDIQKISKLRKDSHSIFNINFTINNDISNNKNIIVYINYKSTIYYFILFFDDSFDKPNFLMKILIHHYLMPIFKKVLQTISFEEHIKDTQLKNKKKILNEMKYVATTNKSLHTLNNQFTPIKTYFKMLDDYNSFDDSKKENLNIMIKKMEKDAKKSFERILNLSEYLLDKNQNPFSIKELRDYKIKVLYMKIKQIWTEKFSEESIIFKFEDNFLNRKITSDMYLLEILFIDILENMSKYTSGNEHILFDYKDNNIIIILSNLVKLSPKDKKKLVTNIQLFNNDDRTQLLLKKGHGFANIKEIVTNLNIVCNISYVDSLFKMKVAINLKE
ncbi:MAG: hypothetical protein K8R39_07030 [Arcobacteraceae bacterium]|nr:hypothetical protein [Arcobacteraceae bacterium]